MILQNSNSTCVHKFLFLGVFFIQNMAVYEYIVYMPLMPDLWLATNTYQEALKDENNLLWI